MSDKTQHVWFVASNKYFSHSLSKASHFLAQMFWPQASCQTADGITCMARSCLCTGLLFASWCCLTFGQCYWLAIEVLPAMSHCFSLNMLIDLQLNSDFVWLQLVRKPVPIGITDESAGAASPMIIGDTNPGAANPSRADEATAMEGMVQGASAYRDASLRESQATHKVELTALQQLLYNIRDQQSPVSCILFIKKASLAHLQWSTIICFCWYIWECLSLSELSSAWHLDDQNCCMHSEVPKMNWWLCLQSMGCCLMVQDWGTRMSNASTLICWLCLCWLCENRPVINEHQSRLLFCMCFKYAFAWIAFCPMFTPWENSPRPTWNK